MLHRRGGARQPEERCRKTRQTVTAPVPFLHLRHAANTSCLTDCPKRCHENLVTRTQQSRVTAAHVAVHTHHAGLTPQAARTLSVQQVWGASYKHTRMVQQRHDLSLSPINRQTSGARPKCCNNRMGSQHRASLPSSAIAPHRESACSAVACACLWAPRASCAGVPMSHSQPPPVLHHKARSTGTDQGGTACTIEKLEQLTLLACINITKSK